MTSKRKAGIARNRADRDQMRRARRTLAAGRQHQPGGRQHQPASRQPAAAAPGVAVATGCSQCWAAFGMRGGREYQPGRFLAAIHIGHVGDLEAAGWAVWPRGMYDDGIPDVVCPHIAPDVVT